MEKSSKAGYKPTALALEYQRNHSFDPDQARLLLAPAFVNSWFFKALVEQLQNEVDGEVATG